jgi:aldose 1-epimerase
MMLPAQAPEHAHAQLKEPAMVRINTVVVLSVALVFLFPGCTPMIQTTPKVQQAAFGMTNDGKPVELFTLSNRNGLTVKLISYGATIIDVHAPDRHGTFADVTLGYDSIKGLQNSKNPYFGATIGRYGNRIAKGRFSIDGRDYQVPVNNGPNSLHGGRVGFDKVIWDGEILNDLAAPTVRFKYTSPDGDQGYPGTLVTYVTFSLNDKNELRIDYDATTDAPTPINLTNHTYWNLSGNGSNTILDTVLQLNADRFTPVDADLIPTGVIQSVKGTAMDFTSPMPIGSRIGDVQGANGGYDHNYVVTNGGMPGKLVLIARAVHPQTGRVLEVETDQPGVQFYTGNFLDGTIAGKGGTVYPKHAGFCLETQHFPDSPNHANFPNTILRPGERYRTSTIYRFSAMKN